MPTEQEGERMSPTIVNLHPDIARDGRADLDGVNDLPAETRAILERDDQLISSINAWGVDTERRMQGIEGKHRGNVDLLRQENAALKEQVQILTDRVSALEAAMLVQKDSHSVGVVPAVLAGCTAIVALLLGLIIGRR